MKKQCLGEQSHLTLLRVGLHLPESTQSGVLIPWMEMGYLSDSVAMLMAPRSHQNLEPAVIISDGRLSRRHIFKLSASVDTETILLFITLASQYCPPPPHTLTSIYAPPLHKYICMHAHAHTQRGRETVTERKRVDFCRAIPCESLLNCLPS